MKLARSKFLTFREGGMTRRYEERNLLNCNSSVFLALYTKNGF